MKKSVLGVGLSCLSVGLLACPSDGDDVEISSSQAALTASENSERALKGLVDAADFLSESNVVAQALGRMGGTSESCSSSAVYCTGDSSCTPTVICETEEVDAADVEEARAELRENVEDLVRHLRERVLIPANLESETSTSATYRLGASVLCDADEPVVTGSPGSAPGPTSDAPQYDEDCVEQANRLQLRLRLTSPREGDVDVTVLIGQARNEPLVFELHRSSLGLRVDLGEAMAVARELGEDSGDLEQLSGELQLQLVENAARDYSLELNVLSALKAVLRSEGERLEMSLGASSPALELRVDGNARRVLAGMDLRSFRLVGPLRLFADAFGDDSDTIEPAPNTFDLVAPEPAEPNYYGAIDLFLSGLQGTLEYVAESDVLQLNGLGFGDATSTLEHDGRTLLALDLNAAQGRHVDLVLEPEGEQTKITISPSFDLKLALAFHHIADQVEGIAEHLLDDTWHFWSEGDEPAVIAEEGQLRVVSGALHFESAADPSANVTVPAGMCLLESEAAIDDSDESLESDDWRHQLSAGVCQ